MDSALARAYGSNPSLNARRALVRATDENIPQALSLSRPRVSATGDVGVQFSETQLPGGAADASGGSGAGSRNSSTTTPRGVGLQADQNLFNGFRTQNSTRRAESQVLAARESLRTTEQTVLIDAVTAYMDVLRDTATLSLQRNNIEVIEEQLRQTRERFNVGEVTRTDVAQSESRLAAARSQASSAEAQLRASIARFRQVIGVEPRQLAPGRPIDRLLPRTMEGAIGAGLVEHPEILEALHAVDAAELTVKITEAELYPRADLVGSVTQRFDTQVRGDERFTSSLVGRVTVPIYEGGEVYARVRQAKETVGQRRIEAETARDRIRATVVSAWGQLEASKAQILAEQARVEAAEIALAGTREEARVGQRTTLDVLNAQQELLIARVNLIAAQRNRVVASYAVVQAMGRLTARTLALSVAQYSAKQHFDQVKDLWYGVRTPDGR